MEVIRNMLDNDMEVIRNMLVKAREEGRAEGREEAQQERTRAEKAEEERDALKAKTETLIKHLLRLKEECPLVF